MSLRSHCSSYNVIISTLSHILDFHNSTANIQNEMVW